MGYIPKYIQEMMDKIDDRPLPSDWNDFIYDIEKNHNLILKNKNTYFCTNCQQYFNSNKDLKIQSDAKCPICKYTYEVRSNKIKNYELQNNIMLLEKVIIPEYKKTEQSQFVLRLFQISSTYNSKKSEFDHSTVEYVRMLVNDEYRELRNERISPSMGAWRVNHYRVDNGKWRMYTGNGWYEAVPHGYIYTGNLKETLKDTRYENSRLWEAFPDNTKQNYNMKDWIYAAKCNSFEMLIELRLYNLAVDAEYFSKTGSFMKIFGVSKDYYEFIKKHNLDYSELKILRKYPIKNIRTLRFLMKHQYALKEIQEYTTIDNFIKYFRKKHLSDAHLYRDYLRFAKELGFNLKDKKYLFPDRLKTVHNRCQRQVEQARKEKKTKIIKRRAENLAKYIFKNKEFVIYPANSMDALIEESTQQNNCVRTYAERYAKGDCDIYFMRKVDEPKKSLVTVEVKNNKVVQKRTKNNEKTNKKQDAFLDIWQKEVLQKREMLQKRGA